MTHITYTPRMTRRLWLCSGGALGSRLVLEFVAEIELSTYSESFSPQYALFLLIKNNKKFKNNFKNKN